MTKPSWRLPKRISALLSSELAGPADPIESRRAGEGRKPPASGGKRRGRPPTGRTAVLNTTVTPAVKDKLAALAHERGIGAGHLIEQLLDELSAMSVTVALRSRRGKRKA
jgi:hypothetical protein